MTLTQAIGTILLTAGATATIVTYNSLIDDLQERFPNHDRKWIRKAYHRFIVKAMFNRYGDMAPMTEEQMDELFRDELYTILNK